MPVVMPDFWISKKFVADPPGMTYKICAASSNQADQGKECTTGATGRQCGKVRLYAHAGCLEENFIEESDWYPEGCEPGGDLCAGVVEV